MIARLIKIAVIASMLFTGISAQASPISVDLLAPTDPLHLVFLNSAKTSAVSEGVNYYYNFVHTLENNAGIGNDVGHPALTWDAIISKPMIGKLNHVNINYPVYTSDGSLVAIGAFTWDRQINTSISLTESGTGLSDYTSQGIVRERIPGDDYVGREIWVRSGKSHLLTEPLEGGQLAELQQLLPPMISLGANRTIEQRPSSYIAALKPASNGARLGWMGKSQAMVPALEVQQPVGQQNIFDSWNN